MVTSREELVEKLRAYAKQVGKTSVPRREFLRATGISERKMLACFDTYRELCEAAGLAPDTRFVRKEDDEYLEAMRETFIELGTVTTAQRFERAYRYSIKPLQTRFGTWPEILLAFRDWLVEKQFDFPHMDQLNDRISEARFSPQDVTNAPSTHHREASTINNNEIFIVHGHDGEVREAVARFIQSLGLRPIILGEQASKGRTIIEKFEDYGDVGFAVVLLTADDLGRAKNETELKPRARQNVILELGYFVGRLGRDRVCALVRGQALERPSDIHGIVWTDFEKDWKIDLARELRAAGYGVDLNNYIK